MTFVSRTTWRFVRSRCSRSSLTRVCLCDAVTGALLAPYRPPDATHDAAQQHHAFEHASLVCCLFWWWALFHAATQTNDKAQRVPVTSELLAALLHVLHPIQADVALSVRALAHQQQPNAFFFVFFFFFFVFLARTVTRALEPS